MDYTQDELAEFFEYLDDLRESGETNMFGARPYLADEFDMGQADSARILSAWMNTFDGESTADVRAAKALGAVQ